VASAPASPPDTHLLLHDLLRRVSRSFYLTLNVLPGGIRDPVGLAYLFARAADTIADTDLIERPRRLAFLESFKGQFSGAAIRWAEVQAIQAAVLARQSDSAERALLEALDSCFQVYLALPAADQERIRALMTVLVNGMIMDLNAFPGDSAEQVSALPTLEDLDRYTYYVAGCVGEFWTGMTCAHLPSLASWDQARMAAIGVRFGKGLQLTNILKDLPRDLQRGRCYIPSPLLEEAGLKPADLLKPDSLPAARPVLQRLLRLALDHLDQGWLYTMAIPRREIRLRLACMWPILFAGATLRRLAGSSAWLDPQARLKISKGEVYRIMALTTVTGGCGRVGTAYWLHLRKQIV